MDERRRLRGEDLLSLVDLGILERGELGDLAHRQEREQLQEPLDVGVLGVAPELPVVVGRQVVLVEPHGAGGGLAHLSAGRRGQQGTGERIELMRAHAPAEIHAHDDVAPLVGAAHLQVAGIAPCELDEVVALQQHVVELDERQLLLTVEAQLRRIHRQHSVDREMAADVTQELDVVQRRQPLGIVDHDGLARAVAERQEPRKHALDRILVRVDGLDGKNAPRLVAARGIADARGAAAHQRDRLAGARGLQPVQHHDRQQMADVERGGGAVVADVGDDLALCGERIESGKIGALMDVAALDENVQEIGLVRRHGVGSPS